ncbi:uncharacterized protein (DUF58 family) [Kibdelosporangium banguiense]|uniref:Uncharacterized protein (DUF58 family) n=1 Tax=Kibdelosporangium banguiense TaxID=1365924 RepID=A0ABS4TCM9_9PSEU|nr:DUF58 domain-containing protein [Kibdelosporangium banguiense]MBP2321581.1 uncharacterized protein (DUF58 family) [Kibdelosporangium banguiense]
MLTRTGAAVGISTVALLAAGILAGYPELVMIGLAGVVALVVAALWMLLRPQIGAVREIRPHRVTEGNPARAVLTVKNTGTRRSPPLVVTETVADQRVTVPLPSLAAGASHETTYPLPTGRRGRYSIPALMVGHSDPLRLMYVGSPCSGGSVLYVHPRIHHVVPVALGGPRDMEGPTSSRSPQGGIAFHSLRDYQPGDDWRLIDWKSTARTGSLVVRHNVIPDEPQHLIVLDTSSEPYSGSSFEDAVRVAASLCSAASQAAFPIDLRLTAEDALPSGDSELGALDLLAGAEPGPADPGLSTLADLLNDVLAGSDGTVLAVVTGRASSRDIDILSSLGQRFLTVSLVQISERPTAAPRGVIAVNASTSDRFAALWNQLVPQ